MVGLGGEIAVTDTASRRSRWMLRQPDAGSAVRGFYRQARQQQLPADMPSAMTYRAVPAMPRILLCCVVTLVLRPKQGGFAVSPLVILSRKSRFLLMQCID